MPNTDVSLVFDMDGVLLDTESLAMKSWKVAFSQFGFDASDDVLISTIGIGLEGTIEICRSHFGDLPYEKISERRFHIADQIIAAAGLPAKQGIPNLIKAAKEQCSRVGVATSTPFHMARERLRYAEIFSLFDTVIGGDMVERGKPEPDIYIRAAESLGVEPRRCIAVEDSGPGIVSASSAGMRVVFLQDLVVPDADTLSCCTARYSNAEEMRAALSDLLTRA